MYRYEIASGIKALESIQRELLNERAGIDRQLAAIEQELEWDEFTRWKLSGKPEPLPQSGRRRKRT